MVKIRDGELADLSANFAGKYVEKNFQRGAETSKWLVLNCVAHGYYMGVRHAEKIYNRTFFAKKPPLSDDALDKESLHAANYYLTKKNLTNLDWSQQALVRATVAHAFSEGIRFYERAGNP